MRFCRAFTGVQLLGVGIPDGSHEGHTGFHMDPMRSCKDSTGIPCGSVGLPHGSHEGCVGIPQGSHEGQ
eukprot:6239806-Pyramimonas_sp.AAC.1